MSETVRHCSEYRGDGTPRARLERTTHDGDEGTSENQSDYRGDSTGEDDAERELEYSRSTAPLKTTKSLPTTTKQLEDSGNDVKQRDREHFEQAKSMKMLQERYQEQERALQNRDKWIEHLGERAITYKRKLVAFADRYAVERERGRLLTERIGRRDRTIFKLEERISELRRELSGGGGLPTRPEKRDITRRCTLPGRLQRVRLED